MSSQCLGSSTILSPRIVAEGRLKAYLIRSFRVARRKKPKKQTRVGWWGYGEEAGIRLSNIKLDLRNRLSIDEIFYNWAELAFFVMKSIQGPLLRVLEFRYWNRSSDALAVPWSSAGWDTWPWFTGVASVIGAARIENRKGKSFMVRWHTFAT